MFQKSQEKRIRIGIDARFYGPKQKGLGRYVQKLVENLEGVDLVNQYIIFLRKENWAEYQPTNPNFKKILADYSWYGLKEQVLMPLRIWQEKVDLMHFPHFNVPVFNFTPFIITIHDLILKRFPTRRASRLNPVAYWLKNLGYRIIIYSAVKRTKKVIAVSNYTKKDILKYFRVEPTKIEVIYEGASEEKPKTQSSKLFKKSINKPYLLYVGNAYPHKNLERLILAFERLVKDKKMDLQLVLVGELDYFYKRLKNMVDRLMPAVCSKIIFTDFVSDEELSNLYQNASLYVFPSLCEGFGLPPLEAMTYCLPVASSRAACLPEVLGQAAVYFNPENTEEIMEKIKQTLEDKELQKELIYQGQQTIQKYSWLKMAQETLKVYR